MLYGDEHCIEAPGGVDLDELPARRLEQLFRDSRRLTRFASSPDRSLIHDPANPGIEGLTCYRINRDCLFEINNAVLRTPLAIRNRVADVISFQFVSRVKRSEYLGKRRNIHNLGPALIVSVVPRTEVTYRVPQINVQIQHVVVTTTLSTLMERMREDQSLYPNWLLKSISGEHNKPRQRVFFLEDVHRDSIWSCFHLPVADSLLGHWMSAKFDELLCIGLQILKNSRHINNSTALDTALPHGEIIRRARSILSMEYANPPPVPKLAQQLGISETRLKSGFKTMNGTTVLQFCINKRLEAAKLLLQENRHPIAEIGSMVGYEDHSAFSRTFRRHTGCSPKQWRKDQDRR